MRWRAAERAASWLAASSAAGGCFDPSGMPLQAGEAIRGFLEALGVPSGQIPATIETQAGLLRSMMASRSVLIVADNARDADQVRPLLPGNRACLVLLTSRCQLIGLVAAYGATPIGLGLLTRAEALQLLGHRLGGHRLADETCAAEELITGCAGLPLALTVAAARATARLG